MSNLQAAIGCAQLERVDELVARKREILAFYKERLAATPGVAMNPEPEGTANGGWMPTIVFDAELRITREMLQRAFAEDNIDARVFFYPLSSLPMFEPVPGNEHAYSIPPRAFNLPSYHDMTAGDQLRVVAVIHGLLASTPSVA
jgi:perosamine synthetase